MTDLQITLSTTRNSALAVHGALLESTRRGWERRHGRITNTATLLRLVIDDPEFAWLDPLTTLIAALDEAMDDRTPGALDRARPIAQAIVDLLRADEAGSSFQARYHREINESADLAVVAARARPGLLALPLTWN